VISFFRSCCPLSAIAVGDALSDRMWHERAKLSQNRSIQDRAVVVAGLCREGAARARTVASTMQEALHHLG
jgi:predicted FMN-binding regulatory protein PaiB